MLSNVPFVEGITQTKIDLVSVTLPSDMFVRLSVALHSNLEVSLARGSGIT